METGRAVHFLVCFMKAPLDKLTHPVLRFPLFPHSILNSASVCGPPWSALGCSFCLPCVTIVPWDSRSFLLRPCISVLSSRSWLRLPSAASSQFSRSLLNSRGLGCSLFLLAEEVLVCAASAGRWGGGEVLWGWVRFCLFFLFLVFFQSCERNDRLHGVYVRPWTGVIRVGIFIRTVCCGFCCRPEAVCSSERFSGRCNSFIFLTEQLFVSLRSNANVWKYTLHYTCFDRGVIQSIKQNT